MFTFLLMFNRLRRGVRRSLADPAFRGLLTVFGIILLLGTVFYNRVEGWSLVDSLYFCVVTAATVGYGDLTPQTTLGKLFTIMYMLMAVGVFVSIAASLAVNLARPVEQREEARHGKARRG